MQKKNGGTENGTIHGAPQSTESEIAGILSILQDAESRNTENDRQRSEAFAKLCGMYQPLMDKMVRRFSLSLSTLQMDRHELEDEARIALFCAAKEYRENCHTTFGLYAGICIRNRLISCVRRYKKNAAEQSAKETYLSLSPCRDMDPGEQIISRDAFREAMQSFFGSLTEYERRVFDLYIRASSYKEIAEKLSVPEKSVDNALYRIRVKLKKHLQK